MTRQGKRIRRITPSEWFYLCMEPELPPFSIQLKIEMARPPSDEALARALVTAAAANPSARLQARGRWWWDEGRSPHLTLIANGTPFSLQHPALLRRLPMDLGPPIELQRWEGTGLVLRCAHALMDAAGLIYFAEELFRALRGEALLGSCADLDDWSVLATSPHRRQLPRFKPEWPSPAGPPLDVPKPGFIHEVRRVYGRVDSPTARIASVFARTGGSGCHLIIPVDLRMADERLRTTANLSNPLILTFEAGWDSNTCWREILGALQRHQEFGVARGSAVLPWLPMRMMGRLLGGKQSQQMSRGRHYFTALCSNLARTRLAAFACDGSIPTRVGFLPFDTPGAGLNLLTLQNDDALELAASCPAASGGQGRLSRLLDEVCAELERGVSSQPPQPRQRNARILIAASFVAEPIARVLTYWMRAFGLSLEPAFAPYGQVFQSLTDPRSGFAANPNGVNVVLVRLEDWCRSTTDADKKNLHMRLRKLADEFLAALERVAARGDALVVVWLAPLSQQAQKDPVLSALLEPLQHFIQGALQGMQGIHQLDDEQVRRWYPVTQEEAPLAEVIGHVPYTRDRFAALATALARTIVNAVQPPFKVIVVDCDNTLWQGVCAEVGAEGVEVTAHHRVLQEFLLRQLDDGMLVCVCSRNEPADVQAVFERNGEMVLSFDHLVASRINWLPKSENLLSLAAELRLGLDSFVFLDDNPVECAEVRAHCPGVQIVQVPTDASEIPVLLEHLWGLEPSVQSGGVLARTQMYRQNRRREAVRAESESFKAFLDSLELRVSVAPPTPDQWERVSELSRRTNQFNLAPFPRPAAYFQGLAPAAHCLAVEVEDRFGAYGLTGVVTWCTLDGTLYVNDWMLSCRVLGRGVEHRVLVTLGEIAAQAGCEDIVFCHVPSARNTPARAFLESICDRLPPTEGATGVWLHISALEACNASCRETGPRPVLLKEAVQLVATDATSLPVGVLDLVANTLRSTAQVRAAAGDLSLDAFASAHDDDELAGLLTIARSIAGAELAVASPDDSLIDLGMDSLQIVTLLDEAARLHGLKPDDPVFNGGLGDFLARPTLRELASMLTRVPKGPST